MHDAKTTESLICAWLAFVLVLAACLPSEAKTRARRKPAAPPPTHEDYLREVARRVPRSGLDGRMEIVTVATEGLLPEGTPRDHARVMAFHPARDWEVIPFQIDPREEPGKYIFPPDERATYYSAIGPSDEVVFRAGDTGVRAARTAWPEGVTAGGEIEVRDPRSSARGWVYVFSFERPPLADGPPQVRYTPASDTTDETIETPWYRVSFSRGWHGIDVGVMNGLWLRISSPTAARWRSGVGRGSGFYGPNLLDRMKRRYDGELRFLPGRDWRLDESRIRQEPRGVIAGPIRVIRRVHETFPFELWLDGVQDTTAEFYADRIVLHDVDRVPGRVRRLVSGQRDRIAWDFAIPKGALAYAAAAPAGVFVDAKPSFAEYRLSSAPSGWWALAAPEGGALLALYESGVSGPPKIFYRDDATPDPPETTLGASPTIGWRIEGGEGGARIHLLVLDRFPPGGEEGPMRALRQPLQVRKGPGLGR